MSYILEALKKADAAREREREAVPGLHSRHDHALPEEPDDARSETTSGARTPWLVGGVAGGVVIAGALFWLLGRSGPEAPTAARGQPMPTQGQVTDAPAMAVSTAPAPLVTEQLAQNGAAATPAVPSPPAVPTTPVTPVAPPVAAQPAVQAPPPPPPRPALAETTATTAPLPATTTRLPTVGAAPTPAPTSPAGGARTTPTAQDPLRVDPSLREPAPKVVSIQELPDNIRRELPQLNVGGAMHSDVAANRMLVLNGGVYREGDQPAPGVVLEEIRLKSAVLRYKGHRYSISY